MQATKNCLDAAVASGAKHFILLSAICVQKPLLEFQKAKLKFEAELQDMEGITHSIVRPTAFFKSLAGQVESVKKGGPYVMFGDGHLAACKPISEEDLAKFMADCVTEADKINKVCIWHKCSMSNAEPIQSLCASMVALGQTAIETNAKLPCLCNQC
jgi:divinyl chlorophyllide a 8-vinyl-reductase